MKFPIVDMAFGHPKVILEIRGNATGIVEQRHSTRYRRRFPASAPVVGRPMAQPAARLFS